MYLSKLHEMRLYHKIRPTMSCKIDNSNWSSMANIMSQIKESYLHEENHKIHFTHFQKLEYLDIQIFM